MQIRFIYPSRVPVLVQCATIFSVRTSLAAVRYRSKQMVDTGLFIPAATVACYIGVCVCVCMRIRCATEVACAAVSDGADDLHLYFNFFVFIIAPYNSLYDNILLFIIIYIIQE
jgi:hypothetical protein